MSETGQGDRLTGSTLRVGLLVDSLTQPHWVCRIVEQIRTSTFASLDLVVVGVGMTSPAGSRSAAASGNLLYRGYMALDGFFSRSRLDAFEMSNIETLIDGCPRLAAPQVDDETDAGDAIVDRILEYDLDVALNFVTGKLRGRFPTIARCGVWSHHHGDAQLRRRGPAGVWEVIGGDPVTASMLLAVDGAGERVIHDSYATTHPISVRTSRNNYFWKSTGFALRKLRDLSIDGSLDGKTASSSHNSTADVPYRGPTNLEMFRFFLRVAHGGLRSRARRTVAFDQWILAWGLQDERRGPITDQRSMKKILPPKDRDWADPFPVQQGNDFFVFIEEYPYRTRRGFLSVIRIDEHGTWKHPQPVLEEPYHLSYPFVFRWRGEHYMVPESSNGGRVVAYRSTSFPFGWEPCHTLLSDVRGVDPTLFELDGTWWMFVNIPVEGARFTDELHLFHADRPFGPWIPHRRNPVKSDVRSSRPAGRIFELGGRWYRPAQDSSVRPGYGITLNVIDRLDRSEYAEHEETKILPGWDRSIVSTHTLNHAGRLTVTDWRFRRRRYGA